MTVADLILFTVKAVATVIQASCALMLWGASIYLLAVVDPPALQRARTLRRMTLKIIVFLILSLIGTWWGVRL